METIGSKRSYALIWCMPNNDDDETVTHPSTNQAKNGQESNSQPGMITSPTP